MRNKKRFLTLFHITIPSHHFQFYIFCHLSSVGSSKTFEKIQVPLHVGIYLNFFEVVETYISLLVVVKSDDGNQTHTRIYLHGSVTDGFPKTKTSAPPNKHSGKHHNKTSLKTILIKLQSFSIH